MDKHGLCSVIVTMSFHAADTLPNATFKQFFYVKTLDIEHKLHEYCFVEHVYTVHVFDFCDSHYSV